MKKEIYGIYDTKTKNFGDICILDRDEEFRDGCIDLFSNPEIPEYIVQDLVGVNYGYLTFDSDELYPVFHIHDRPRTVFSGSSPMVGSRRHIRMEQSSSGEDPVDEDLHLAELRSFSDLDSGPADYPDFEEEDI